MQWSIELWGYHVTIWQFAGNLSFGLTALSFYVRDMLALRALSIVAGAIGVVYNYFLPQGALWLVIFWLCVFMAINGFRIAHLVLERRGVSFNDEERELFETVFKNFEPVEFMKLLRIGEWRSAEANAVLTVEGETVEELVMMGRRGRPLPRRRPDRRDVLHPGRQGRRHGAHGAPDPLPRLVPGRAQEAASAQPDHGYRHEHGV